MSETASTNNGSEQNRTTDDKRKGSLAVPTVNYPTAGGNGDGEGSKAPTKPDQGTADGNASETDAHEDNTKSDFEFRVVEWDSTSSNGGQ